MSWFFLTARSSLSSVLPFIYGKNSEVIPSRSFQGSHFRKPSWLLLRKGWDPPPTLKDKKRRQCPVFAVQGVGWTLHAHPTLAGSGHASSSLVKHAYFLLGLDLEQRQLLGSLVRGLFSDSYRKKKKFID